MQSDRVLALFKFGQRDHIDLFVREGHIYMNSLNYFKRLEGDVLRADNHECASYSEQADGAKLSMKENGKWLEIGTISGPIVPSDDSDLTTNVFCMYALRESASIKLVDERNFNFGDSYAVLSDGDEFLRRVHAAAEKENIVLKQNLIEYVDKATYSGPMGIFRKFSAFDYQSEFRLAVVTGSNGPFSLKIGDISDISMIGPLAELNKRIRITSGEP